MTTMDKIDTHHHILPPEYVQAWNNASGVPKGMKMPEWSCELSLDFMSRNGIGSSILSLSAPAMTFVKNSAEAAALARHINEYAASLRDRYPARFGFFATLPSPDNVDASLKELAYSLDVLKADGVMLLTSYNGQYLGHPVFRRLWDELDRRAAVVFIHPNSDIHAGALKEPWLPPPIIDFPHETTRTAVHLIIANTIRDHPNCKVILSHGGGTLPYMATRIAYQSEQAGFMQKSAADFLDEARSFYFDLALTAYSYPLDLLRTFAKEGRILYGSDFPFARAKNVEQQSYHLDKEMGSMKEEERSAITRDSALYLFPRLAQ